MSPDPAATVRHVEGIARVVAVERGIAWLEPEQTAACGGCAAAPHCGAGADAAAGIGSVARRLAARRFALERPAGLRVGERIVVGVADGALLRAALAAYGLPLAAALAAAVLGEWAAGDDLATLASMASGLLGGMLLARIATRRLAARGDLAPTYLRRAGANEACGSN